MLEYMDVARVGLGTFFAISGYHKLFNTERHASLVDTLQSAGIPFIRFNQWWVPSVEFLAGLALIAGLLTNVAALGLLVICLVACATDGRQRVRDYEPIDFADRVDDWLYLPEVLYAFLLGYFVWRGGSELSLDHYVLPLVF